MRVREIFMTDVLRVWKERIAGFGGAIDRVAQPLHTDNGRLGAKSDRRGLRVIDGK